MLQGFARETTAIEAFPPDPFFLNELQGFKCCFGRVEGVHPESVMYHTYITHRQSLYKTPLPEEGQVGLKCVEPLNVFCIASRPLAPVI